MPVLKYFQLPFSFDAKLMQQEVKLLADKHWQLHYQKMHYTGEWSAIPLRSIGGKADNIIISPTDDAPYLDTIFLDKTPYLKQVLETFQCPLQAVRLLKLNAGAVIKEHRDAELSFGKGEIRIHIPIITHEEVAFYLDKERIILKEGDCWYMNFNLPHAITNNSNVNRIHLVIDAKVNEWVEEIFKQSSPNKKEIEEPGMDISTQQQIIAQLRAMNTETGNRIADEMEASLQLNRVGTSFDV